MEKLFVVENLSFSYGADEILKNVTFEIFEGDFIGIVGKNGSGKTTLLKLLLNQLKPTSGRIKSKKNLKVGYVEQITMSSDNTFPASVLEIVLLGLSQSISRFSFFNASHKKTALLALEQVGLKGFEKKQLANLSGGQQQKVLIAKTLVEDPDLLILDEPTTGIDSESQNEFFKLLKHLNQKHNKTILIVTHSIDKVLSTNRLLKVEDKGVNEYANI
jgi:zinc transport system ATP-binding protein